MLNLYTNFTYLFCLMSIFVNFILRLTWKHHLLMNLRDRKVRELVSSNLLDSIHLYYIPGSRTRNLILEFSLANLISSSWFTPLIVIEIDFFWDKPTWKSKTPSKVKVFMWTTILKEDQHQWHVPEAHTSHCFIS